MLLAQRERMRVKFNGAVLKLIAIIKFLMRVYYSFRQHPCTRGPVVKSRRESVERERERRGGGESRARNGSPFPMVSLVNRGRVNRGPSVNRSCRYEKRQYRSLGDEFRHSRNSLVTSGDPKRYLSCTPEFIGTVNSVKAHPSAPCQWQRHIFKTMSDSSTYLSSN